VTGFSDSTSAAATLSDAVPEGRPDAGRRHGLTGLLLRPRYEVLPLAGTLEQVQRHVPTALPVTVTASPARGLEPTLRLTESLALEGFSAVPHLAARLVHDELHLAEILGRLDAVGVRDVFVVAGDGTTPVGQFTDSLHLLTAMERQRRSASSQSLRSVGVAGYPEGNPLVSDAELDHALLAKQPMSSYVVTQMCFDAGAIHRWIGHARGLGIRLPVHVGVAGAVDRMRLLRIAGRIGVGTSLRFLNKQKEGRRLLRRGGYRPDDLLGGLTPHTACGDRRVAGLHVYTFNDLAATEHWRRELLDMLADGSGHD